MIILTTSISTLQIYKREKHFHCLTSSISSLSLLRFSLYESFDSMVRFIKDILPFEGMVNGLIFLFLCMLVVCIQEGD